MKSWMAKKKGIRLSPAPRLTYAIACVASHSREFSKNRAPDQRTSLWRKSHFQNSRSSKLKEYLPIDDTSTPSDNAALARIDSRIDSLMSESRPHLEQESEDLLSELDARDFSAVRRSLARVDALRDQLNEKIDAVRTEMLKVSYRAIATIR